MLTTFDLEDYVYAALRAGASGFLLKDAPAEQLVAAIEVVARGDALLAPQVTRLLIEEVARRPTRDRAVPGLDRLTEREVEVLRLMARGMSNSEIAGQLYLGEATVKTHVGRVLDKLDARDRVQAVVAAYESGLVEPGRPLITPALVERRRVDDVPRDRRIVGGEAQDLAGLRRGPVRQVDADPVVAGVFEAEAGVVHRAPLEDDQRVTIGVDAARRRPARAPSRRHAPGASGATASGARLRMRRRVSPSTSSTSLTMTWPTTRRRASATSA